MKKKTVVRQLSTYIGKKFDGFYIVGMENDRKFWKKYSPNDIIYGPFKC